jgi:hypothetical protein
MGVWSYRLKAWFGWKLFLSYRIRVSLDMNAARKFKRCLG